MSQLRRYAIIEAPSILGLKPSGVEKLPERLLKAGLAERLHARHATRLATLLYDSERDPTTLTLNRQRQGGWHRKFTTRPSTTTVRPGGCSPIQSLAGWM